MLLAIDIGNSHLTFGVFDNETLVATWRCETKKLETSEEYKVQLIQKSPQITDVVIGSVVPELDKIFLTLSREFFKTDPLFVSTKLKSNVTNLSEKETGLGADRLADIVAAITPYPGNRIIIDLGTASKFEAVSGENMYQGGAIGPGIGISFEALLARASKLTDFSLQPPQKVVGGFTTEEHLNSGFSYGFASMVDGMVQKMTEELTWAKYTAILTGGFSEMIAPFLKEQVIVNPHLTLEGLRLLWEQNRENV